MAKSQFDSLYIPTKAGPHTHAIACADAALIWLIESAVTCKFWQATHPWKSCTSWLLPTRVWLYYFGSPMLFAFSVLHKTLPACAVPTESTDRDGIMRSPMPTMLQHGGQCLFTGLDYWTHPKWPFPTFFIVGEKMIMFIQPTSLLNLLP